MKYDWNKDWYEGDMGEEKRIILRDRPIDVLLALLIGAALLVWWGIA